MEKPLGTPGGAALRDIRKQAAMTQDTIEIEAGIGKGKLHRIEQGIIQQPKYETLERILAVLGATYTQRQRVFKLYHAPPIPEPTHAERQMAIEMVHDKLQQLPFPAYLLDCADLLLDWNDLLLNITCKTPHDMEHLRYLSLNFLLFDEQYGLTQLVADPDSLFPNILRALWSEMQPYQDEPWCRKMIKTACNKLPRFNHYWTHLNRDVEPPPQIIMRPELPIALNIPAVGRLDFRVSSNYMTHDNRFRVVYYIPANARTMYQCARWAE